VNSVSNTDSDSRGITN